MPNTGPGLRNFSLNGGASLTVVFTFAVLSAVRICVFILFLINFNLPEDGTVFSLFLQKCLAQHFVHK